MQEFCIILQSYTWFWGLVVGQGMRVKKMELLEVDFPLKACYKTKGGQLKRP